MLHSQEPNPLKTNNVYISIFFRLQFVLRKSPMTEKENSAETCDQTRGIKLLLTEITKRLLQC